jgi:hypothetical protein
MSSQPEQQTEHKLSPEEARLLIKAIEEAEKDEAEQQERMRRAIKSPRRSER